VHITCVKAHTLSGGCTMSKHRDTHVRTPGTHTAPQKVMHTTRECCRIESMTKGHNAKTQSQAQATSTLGMAQLANNDAPDELSMAYGCSLKLPRSHSLSGPAQADYCCTICMQPLSLNCRTRHSTPPQHHILLLYELCPNHGSLLHSSTAC
jgi:hypothetical protein